VPGLARQFNVPSSLARAGKIAAQCIGIGAVVLLLGGRTLQSAIANGDTRTLSFHHVHTNETITVTFKRDGRYDADALKKLDWFLRDWRKDQQVDMDPQLFDLLWTVYREVGATQPIEILCGYRSPATNAMLRKTSAGVAEDSLHTHGDAIDFFIPGVPLEKIRNAGLRLQRGGVGFYPTSGSPFIHLDVGSIRHWPGMTHDQLVKVFPNGRTVHVPSDGQPLKGYALALADVERQGHRPSALSLASARKAGVIGETEEMVASAGEAPQQSLTATVPDAVMNDPTKRSPAAPIMVASAAPASQVTTVRVASKPKQRPAKAIALAVPTPKSRPPLPVEVASADPIVTASANALAYAAPVVPAVEPYRPAPQLAFAATTATPGNPWLRATMLAPNVRYFLTIEPTSRLDTRQLQPFLHQPATPVVMMGFSADPQNGMRADRFSGDAVVFLATLKPTLQTAALGR
jgi:uncharacterized protein YcbK (DUF882 family)